MKYNISKSYTSKYIPERCLAYPAEALTMFENQICVEVVVDRVNRLEVDLVEKPVIEELASRVMQWSNDNIEGSWSIVPHCSIFDNNRYSVTFTFGFVFRKEEDCKLFTRTFLLLDKLASQ